MKAIVFDKSIPRYAALKLLGPRRAARLATARWGALCPVSLRDIRRKPFPTGQWVRLTPTMTGICGSDLGVICSKGSPYFSPLTSTPFVLGHEVVGVVTEIGADVARYEDDRPLPHTEVGDRVVIEPALGCDVRGIQPRCPACARGQPALCRNVTRGTIAPGIQTGFCRDTGGGWSTNLIAHRSQLHPVPDHIPDTVAVLAEPLACVLHGVLRVNPRRGQTVLIMGCGSIGLLAVAALRARGCDARIVAVARYPHQRRLALELGADTVLHARTARNARATHRAWAEQLNAELHYPELGRPTVIGGAEFTIDCIGSSTSIDDSIRFTNAAGSVVLIGMPGIPSGIDWTAIWYKELKLQAAYAYGPERANSRPLSGRPKTTAHADRTDRAPNTSVHRAPTTAAASAPAAVASYDDADEQTSTGERSVQTWDLAAEVLESWGDRLAALVGEPFELTDYRRALHAALFTGVNESVKTVFRITP